MIISTTKALIGKKYKGKIIQHVTPFLYKNTYLIIFQDGSSIHIESKNIIDIYNNYNPQAKIKERLGILPKSSKSKKSQILFQSLNLRSRFQQYYDQLSKVFGRLQKLFRL